MNLKRKKKLQEFSIPKYKKYNNQSKTKVKMFYKRASKGKKGKKINKENKANKHNLKYKDNKGKWLMVNLQSKNNSKV